MTRESICDNGGKTQTTKRVSEKLKNIYPNLLAPRDMRQHLMLNQQQFETRWTPLPRKSKKSFSIYLIYLIYLSISIYIYLYIATQCKNSAAKQRSNQASWHRWKVEMSQEEGKGRDKSIRDLGTNLPRRAKTLWRPLQLVLESRPTRSAVPV